MIILTWIGNTSEYFSRNLFISLGLILLFAVFMSFYILVLRKNRDFKSSVVGNLRFLSLIFGGYVLFFLFYILGGYSVISPIDMIIFPILAGGATFMILLISNKIQVFFKKTYVYLIYIPAVFFGVWVIYIWLCLIPYYFKSYSGHSIVEPFFVILYFLLLTSFLLSVNIVYKRIRGAK